MDEVNFVQQLVFCIERAYRTPDYGIWMRGSKYNTNTCELHARLALFVWLQKLTVLMKTWIHAFSSIGMAKAALEAMNGFNLYGEKGASWSVVYVDVVWISDVDMWFRVTLYNIVYIIQGCLQSKSNHTRHTFAARVSIEGRPSGANKYQPRSSRAIYNTFIILEYRCCPVDDHWLANVCYSRFSPCSKYDEKGNPQTSRYTRISTVSPRWPVHWYWIKRPKILRCYRNQSNNSTESISKEHAYIFLTKYFSHIEIW